MPHVKSIVTAGLALLVLAAPAVAGGEKAPEKVYAKKPVKGPVKVPVKNPPAVITTPGFRVAPAPPRSPVDGEIPFGSGGPVEQNLTPSFTIRVKPAPKPKPKVRIDRQPRSRDWGRSARPPVAG